MFAPEESLREPEVESAFARAVDGGMGPSGGAVTATVLAHGVRGTA